MIKAKSDILRVSDPKLRPIARKVEAGERLSEADGLALFETVGILIGLATLAALYLLGSRLAGPAVGLGASLLFLLLSFFAASTWGANFVLPYSYAATLGTAFAMWSFYFLYRYLFDQKNRERQWPGALSFSSRPC